MREATYLAAVEAMTESFWVMEAVRDPSGQICDFRVVDCNLVAASRARLSREQVIGMLYTQIYAAAIESGMVERMRHTFETGETFDGEIAVQAPELAMRHARLKIFPLGTGVAILSEDITARRRFEQERDGFFELSVDMLCIAGMDGVFRRVNAAWQAALGWSVDVLTSKPFMEFVHPEDRARTIAESAKLAQGDLTLAFENRYAHKDGTYRVLEWRAVASPEHEVIFASARDVTEARQAAQIAIRDLAERKKLEQRLVHAERLASLGTLAAGMGHEINNPMVAVVANVSFSADAARTALRALETANPGPEEIGEATSQIRGVFGALEDAAKGADRVRRIVQDLRRFARAETAASVLIEVPAVLEAAIKLIDHELRPHARVVREIGTTPFVMGDEGQLTQVVTNLLLNAAQAISRGTPDENEIRIRTFTDTAGRAVIELVDTGCGMTAETLARIFDPFFTTKRIGEAMGLGLAISHNVVLALGGEITATSAPGKGSTFKVSLPPARMPQKTQTIQIPRIAHTQRANVLVIDDEEVVTRSMQRILGRMHSVEIASDGASALALVARTWFDIILCDLMMPQMSGVDVYESIAASNPEQAARMVFMTGGAFTERTTEFLATTGNRCLLKPFTAETIRGVTAEVITLGTAAT